MAQDQAAGPRVGLRSFLNDAQDQIVSEWRSAVRRTRLGSDAPAASLVDCAPALLEQIASLAEDLAQGASLERTFEVARNGLGGIGETCGISHLLTELSALRSAIFALADRSGRNGGDEAGLRAIHIAIDAVMAAAAERCDQASQSGFEQIAEERQRALGKLESLLAASPVGVAFLDRDLRYLRINDALAAVNGRPAADHIGRSILEMIPDLAGVLEPMLRDVMARGETILNREFTRPSPRQPGELETYLATFFPVRNASGEIMGVGGVVVEITEVRRAQQDLRRVQETMQSILEHAPASIWVKDATGRIVLANHRLADALGHPYERVIGRRSEDLLPADVAAQHSAHDQTVARENRAIAAEEVVPAPDGVRTFLSIKFPLPGDPPMVGAIATDISERKQMEEELRVAVQSREQVLAAVSHDLRNPLSTIQFTSATLLSQLSDDQRWRRHLEIIHRSCLRMGHLITDLLDMASISAGRLSLQTKPEPADEVLREAADLHQPLAEEKKIALVLRALSEDVLIECDRQRVMQVFENVIGNALKFCRAGDTVTLAAERTGGAVCFSVEDSGPGIQAELLARLFDPYWSGPGSANGVGLGLYITRGIVERHRGRIDVQSTVGHGTRFSFTIPIAGEG
jgi:PAS domain S-box-containing protein